MSIFYVSAIRESDVDDVRDVLSYYKQFDDPIAVFRENQRKLQEETLAYEEKMKKETQTKSFSGFTGLSFMRRKWSYFFLWKKQNLRWRKNLRKTEKSRE